ncbi:MAG: 50S ribosomal protein L17 [PVC group bacterium]
MRHRKKTIKLNRTSAHRAAMLANLVSSLIREEVIVTTLAKARAAQPLVEKMITLAKRDTLPARRRAIRTLGDKEAVRKLFSDTGTRFADRAGGCTRLLKFARPRRGDGAAMARLSFLDEAAPPAQEKKADKKASPAPAKEKK